VVSGGQTRRVSEKPSEVALMLGAGRRPGAGILQTVAACELKLRVYTKRVYIFAVVEFALALE